MPRRPPAQPIRKISYRKKKAPKDTNKSAGNYVQSGESGKKVKSKRCNRDFSTEGALRGRYKIPKCKIPKEKLDKALAILETGNVGPVKANWQYSCHFPPDNKNHHHGFKRNSLQKLLSECRVCLLNRDWINLSAILTIAKPTSIHDYVEYMPHFHKYAVICLIHSGEEESLDDFLHGVIGCVTEHDKNVFMKSLTSFYKKEHLQMQT